MTSRSDPLPEFELVYLALLARTGVKPLCRWEPGVAPAAAARLRALGLAVADVDRTLRSGSTIRETVFSRDPACCDRYRERFAGAPVDRSAADIRFEGRLFGYPDCCVESYARHGYRRNDISRADQRILFHWACPECPVTPLLLPLYRRVHAAARSAWRNGRIDPTTADRLARDAERSDPWRRVAAAAGFALAIGLAGGRTATAADLDPPEDPHQVALDPSIDPDSDLLSTDEERRLDTDPHDPDENGNGRRDGVDLALALSDAVDWLPSTPSAAGAYRIDHLAFGLETCATCGERVNMGFIEVVDPLSDARAFLPFIAKHAMEHGSFSYEGDEHAGRIDIAELRQVVMSGDAAHYLPEPLGTDRDKDGLTDPEEPGFGLDPDRRDTDGDGVRDGVDLSRELLARIRGLPFHPSRAQPYVTEHPMDGIEICPRCGAEVVMNIWEIYNPVTGAEISIPSMAVHYLEHGGFRWEGGYLYGGAGRVDPRHLVAVLDGTGGAHRLDVNPDRDADLLSDPEEGELRRDPDNPDEDRNGVIDGVDLATAAADAIHSLPTEPAPDRVHRIDREAKGLETCAICGEQVNMGSLTVCNPIADLYVAMPFVGLHYLEHGGFSYAGSVHPRNRVDVPILLAALDPVGPSHMLPVAGDTDHDGLADDEEPWFGTLPDDADSNGDSIPDGFDLATRFRAEIAGLPRVSGAHPYAVDHLLRGLVRCDQCGAEVNMGRVEIVNPVDGLRMDVSYLELHYMRHGSFAIQGGRRVNPRMLDLVLHGAGLCHLVVVPGDADEDGLLDEEEPHFGCRADLPDSNGNGLLDGVGVARALARRIDALPVGPRRIRPYRLDYNADGYIPCPVCGEMIDMGFCEVIDPRSELRAQVSFMLLHYLRMGSLAASVEERADPLLLDAILRPGVIIAAGERGLRLQWPGEAGRRYQVMFGPGPTGPWSPGPVYDGNGSLIVHTDPTGREGDRAYYRIVAW